MKLKSYRLMSHDELTINKLQSRLHKLGIDIPADTLKGWAYHKPPIITPPERYKHGKGSGKKGRAVKWSEEALEEAAAVWAVRNSPRIAHPPSLNLIPYIKHSVWYIYNEPAAAYELPNATPDTEITYKSIKVGFGYDQYRKLEGKQPPVPEWQELLKTWIAAKEKAKRGKHIDKPCQIRFHWRPVERDDGGLDYKLEKVTLEPSESGLDEISVFIGGADFRKQLFQLLGYSSES